jgi:hypothetical protein
MVRERAPEDLVHTDRPPPSFGMARLRQLLTAGDDLPGRPPTLLRGGEWEVRKRLPDHRHRSVMHAASAASILLLAGYQPWNDEPRLVRRRNINEVSSAQESSAHAYVPGVPVAEHR